MTNAFIRNLLVAVIAAAGAMAQAQSSRVETRGALLYQTHCIACHTSQMHWREQRQARDWPSLRTQVQLWQERAGLQWSEADITGVARHLNETIYHYSQTTGHVSSASRSGANPTSTH